MLGPVNGFIVVHIQRNALVYDFAMCSRLFPYDLLVHQWTPHKDRQSASSQLGLGVLSWTSPGGWTSLKAIDILDLIGICVALY